MPRKSQKTITVRGVQAVLTTLEKIKSDGVDAVRAGLFAEAVAVLDRARHYCPIDTGALRASGRIEVFGVPDTAFGHDQLHVAVKFGGRVGYAPAGKSGRLTKMKDWVGDPDLQGKVVYYAVFVHENMTAYHAPPTSAKFLERALREMMPKLGRIMGQAVQEVLHSRRVFDMGRMKIND